MKYILTGIALISFLSIFAQEKTERSNRLDRSNQIATQTNDSRVVNDSLCNCLSAMDRTDSTCIRLVRSEVFNVDQSILDTLKDEYQDEFLEMRFKLMVSNCEAKGYFGKDLQGSDAAETSSWTPIRIKILGIFLVMIMIGIIKAVLENKTKKQKERLSNLMAKANKVTHSPESSLVDSFTFSFYEGFWQNFSSGSNQECFQLEMYTDKFVFSLEDSVTSIQYNKIDALSFSTTQRGRASIDKYMQLSFSDEDVKVSSEGNSLEALLLIMKSWRIRKANQVVKGNKSKHFEILLEITLEQYVV
jgi:hypothetical protein